MVTACAGDHGGRVWGHVGTPRWREPRIALHHGGMSHPWRAL